MEHYYGVSVSFGNYEYAATMYIDSKTSNISIEFSNPTEELYKSLQDSLGLPVTISSEGIDAEIPLGNYYAVEFSVPVSISSKEDTASLSLGLKGSLKSPLADNVNASGSRGYRITASIQDGTCGTIKNRKDDSLNQNYETYKYSKSAEFIEEFIEQ